MKQLFLFFTLSMMFSACLTSHQPSSTLAEETFCIAFGSCSNQKKEQPILHLVADRNPNVFIYLGDNIYGDTRDMNELQQKYDRLAAKPEFQRLKKSCQILATWDDHDYGENDAGRYYPFKEASKEIFLNFWEEPKSSERWQHKGIYHAVMLENAPLKIQVILLDTRSFRDNLTERKKEKKNAYKNDYQPTLSADSTFLGAAQWAWLENQLKQTADLRIIASSNQFAHEYNGWESWTNVPHEQKRMLQLIQKTQANGVVFISGDVHWGELSKYDNPYTYPIYDITSSGLTQSWHKTEPNKNRIGFPIRKNNFGCIEIKKDKATQLTFKIINKQNSTVVQHQIDLSELAF
ncbi:alkaline phosphatase D family protein [Aureispira anguillae]|uniref:Alkaline phosphatase family protein n=1 Tax=Aureispira anguillae TaxID=2864201 RepID=A0A915VMQ4_9BACT|nr:alkaline phosphatase D family protein [Aureispira anguillae]BDS09519.1 alkaline phosphatase family protein [Aureispira anguillae]